MKRIHLWIMVFLLIPALNAWADDNGGLPPAVRAALGSGRPNDLISNAPFQGAPAQNDQGNHGQQGNQGSNGQNQGMPSGHGQGPNNGNQGNHGQPVSRGNGGWNAPNHSNRPVVIQMGHGASGGHNRNFPSQQSEQRNFGDHNQQPSYGNLRWNNIQGNRGFNSNAIRPYPRPDVQSFSQPGVRTAVAVHHHPYTPGYVRKKLQNMGVTSEPGLITLRSQIIHTDRDHSIIRYPQVGPDHVGIRGRLVSPRHFNDDVVRNNMLMVDSPEWRARLNQTDRMERERGHYYWHNGEDFNYCHYIDDSGYHWYGWYVGDQYYWTRYFSGRWWTYDTDYDRWCFWNNGFWWWQDPYHVGDLYCYNNATYIPCNSANDQIVVAAPSTMNTQDYFSPDSTRMVKVVSETQDAFLYDDSPQPSFAPVYLASGVQNVQFSDTSNGRPLEIILKLNDGSFDMFDDQGNAYGPGAYDQDQENSGNPPTPPAYDE